MWKYLEDELDGCMDVLEGCLDMLPGGLCPVIVTNTELMESDEDPVFSDTTDLAIGSEAGCEAALVALREHGTDPGAFWDPGVLCRLGGYWYITRRDHRIRKAWGSNGSLPGPGKRGRGWYTQQRKRTKKLPLTEEEKQIRRSRQKRSRQKREATETEAEKQTRRAASSAWQKQYWKRCRQKREATETEAEKQTRRAAKLAAREKRSRQNREAVAALRALYSKEGCSKAGCS
eukprot:COSAG01_NODE_1075_length_11852_cov_4.249128_7_plen_232_part_00